MNKRELLKIALLITLLLCTASKGYELYVENNIPTPLNTNVYKPSTGTSPMFYRVSVPQDNKDQLSVLSNVVIVWNDNSGQPTGSRVLEYGDFELIQKEVSTMSDDNADKFIDTLYTLTDNQYVTLINTLKNKQNMQLVLQR